MDNINQKKYLRIYIRYGSDLSGQQNVKDKMCVLIVGLFLGIKE